MAKQSTVREDWNGHPVDLGTAWTLHKGTKLTHCVLVTHPLGWEFRLGVGDLLRSQVFRSTDEIINTQESWRAASTRPKSKRRTDH